MDGFKLNTASDIYVGDQLARYVYVGSTKVWDYKTTPVYTAPTAKSGLVYNGSSQSLLNAGTTSHGTIYYSSNNTDWSTTIPSSTNANSNITVYWKLVGDGRHYDVASTAITCSIAKANRTISFTSAPSSVVVGSTITVVARPSAGMGDGTIRYHSTDTSKATVSGNTVTGVSSGTVTITADISAGVNYKSATTSYSLTVEAVTLELNPTTVSLDYAGTAQTVTVTSNTTWDVES